MYIYIIQLLLKFQFSVVYLLKIHHCSFKVSPMHVLKASWSYSSISWSSPSVSLVFSQVLSALSMISLISSIVLSSGIC